MRMFTHTRERERERKRVPHTKPCTPDRAVCSTAVPRRGPFRSVAWPAAAAAALPHLVLGSSAAVGANCRRHSRQPHRSSCARTGPGQQAVRGDLGPERGRYGQSMYVMVQRVAACASRGSAGGLLAVEGVGSGGRRSLLLPNSCSQRQERVTDKPSRRSSTLSSSAAPDRQPTPVFDAQTYSKATRPAEEQSKGVLWMDGMGPSA